MTRRLRWFWKIVLPVSILVLLFLHIGCIRQAWTLSRLHRAGYSISIFEEGTKADGGEVQLEVSASIAGLTYSRDVFAYLYGTPAAVNLLSMIREPQDVSQADLSRLASLHAQKVSIAGYSQVDDEIAAILSRSSDTKEIILAGSGVSNRGAALLLSMPSVTDLMMGSAKIDDNLHVGKVVDAAPISLNLWHTSIGTRAVSEILANRKVTYLAIASTRVTDDCAEAIANEASALSHQGPWVHGLEFDAGVVDFHLPVDATLG